MEHIASALWMLSIAFLPYLVVSLMLLLPWNRRPPVGLATILAFYAFVPIVPLLLAPPGPNSGSELLLFASVLLVLFRGMRAPGVGALRAGIVTIALLAVTFFMLTD